MCVAKRCLAKRPFNKIGGWWGLRDFPPWPRRHTALGDALQALRAQQSGDALLPYVMAALGHAQHPTHRRHRGQGLIRAHELEDSARSSAISVRSTLSAHTQ